MHLSKYYDSPILYLLHNHESNIVLSYCPERCTALSVTAPEKTVTNNFPLNFAHCEFFISERFGGSIIHTASQTLSMRKIRIASKLKGNFNPLLVVTTKRYSLLDPRVVFLFQIAIPLVISLPNKKSALERIQAKPRRVCALCGFCRKVTHN
mgnify:CR=1 FL=1